MNTRPCRSATLVLAVVLLNHSVARADADVLLPLSQRFAPNAATEEVPSFERHVSPLLGRLGCNGRACHGSFQGRGGFQLSLFGYDFEADHKALTASEKPRVDLAHPAESMILNKPTSDENHEGGQRYTKEGWEYQVLSRWITAGAQDDSDEHPKLTRLEIIPAEITFNKDDEQTELRAIAHWENGLREDVTPLCRFKSNDTEVADVSEAGQVKSLGQGDTHVIVFYDNGITPVPVLRPVSAETAAAYPSVPTPTKIDELVVAKLRRLGIVPSETASDAEFLRRVSLDMTGTLPAPQEVEAFLADAAPDKRARKVDELLERPGYAAWWATRLCDITGNNPRNGANNAFRDLESRQWYDWIYARLEKNVPYDELIEGIVEATGRTEGQSLEDYCREMSSYVRPENPANFAERESMPHYWSQRTKRKPEEKALSFAHAFLGVRIECAQCHKHPFDQWSKQDFEQFTSFFAGIQYGTPNGDKNAYKKIMEETGLAGKKGNDANKAYPQLAKEGKVIPFQEVYVSLKAPNNNNRKKKDQKKADEPTVSALEARLLGGEKLSFKQGDDPRQALMDWMRQEENPYFAKALVNRVWAAYFNVGIIEPADDLSLANPPSNAPLLDWLTREFVAHKYDLKWLHKTIALSNTYQASWRTNATNELDARNFSHAVMRRLPAEVAVDAMQLATAADGEIADFQTGIAKRAIGPSAGYGGNGRGQVNYALATFGKPVRETNCDCERSLDPSLLQTLYLRNDREMLAMIDRRGGWLESVSRQYKLAFQGVEAPAAANRKNEQAKTAELPADVKNEVSKALLDKRKQLTQRLKKLEQQLAKAKKADDKARLEKVAGRLKGIEKELDKANELIAKQRKQKAKVAEVAEGSPPEPETNEATPGEASANVAQVAEKASDQQSPLDTTLQAELIKQVYLRSLSRLPSEAEEARAAAHLRDAKDPITGLRDVFWAVLNTKEFIVNH